MSDLEAWGRKTEEERKEAEESLRDSEANATHILRLVNGTLHMLSYMSAELPVRCGVGVGVGVRMGASEWVWVIG